MYEKLVCIVCGQELSGKQKKFCSKECRNKDSKKYYDKDKNQKSQNLKRLERKIFLLEKYDFKCSKCGYNDNLSALDFHHIDPATKLFPLNSKNLTSKKIEEILEEASKCIVLCANCHREFHNPHTSKEAVKIDSYKTSFIKYNIQEKEKNFCIKCGKEILKKDSKLCQECHAFSTRKVEHPSKEVLLSLITTKSFTELSKEFGVSDTAIKKWCRSYDLPSTKKELKELGYI